jgi:hypothetical protein
MMRFTPVVAILLVCAVAGMAFAGGTPMTAKGDRQLVFRFDGLCDMTLMPYFYTPNFGDECYDMEDMDSECYPCAGGLGFRYFINNDRALRVGVNIALGSLEVKDYMEWGCTEFGASVIYEKYLPQIHSVAPYIGAGVGFTHAKTTATELFGDEIESEWSGNVITVMGVAGFQWYFTEGMSLGGEYRPGFHYETGEWTEDGETLGETSGYVLNHRAASVFLGVHF